MGLYSSLHSTPLVDRRAVFVHYTKGTLAWWMGLYSSLHSTPLVDRRAVFVHYTKGKMGGCKGTDSRCVWRLLLGAKKERSLYLLV